MNSRKKTVALTESALMTAITCVLAIAGIYIPFLGFCMFIISVPFVVLMVRHSWKYVVISAISSAILVTFISFPTYGIYVAIFGGLVGLVMGHYIKEKKDSSYIMFYGALMTSVAFIIILTITTLITGVSLSDIVEKAFTEMLYLRDNMGLTNMMNTSEMQFTEVLKIFKMIIPSSLIVIAGIYSMVNYLIATIIMRRIGMDVSSAHKFSEFALPNNIMAGTTIILVLSYISGKLNIVDSQVLFINILNLFVYVFLIQGIAIMFFFLEKRKLKKSAKILSVVAIFLFQMTLILAIVGWLDNVFDFRKLKKIGVNNEKKQ
ncbi:MAG: DUF2232 domain-containing protein [Clostridiales bacterium]|nr:DUF2232 domain-containing protein [Clostridiales bacterium]